MAKVKCEYCGNYIHDTESTCPKCGAINENHSRVADGTPKTIEELRSWYHARNLPSEEVTRFFIGKDIKEPRAFGIFEENGTFTVYKNKSDGSRAVRYKGTDEAYAVNELYLRLKEEILNQKHHNLRRRSLGNSPAASVYRPQSKGGRLKRIFIFLVLVLIVPTLLFNVISWALFDQLLYSSCGYYISEQDEIFYSVGSKTDGYYEWWIYDTDSEKWQLHSKLRREKAKPEELQEEPQYYSSYYDAANHCGIEPEKLCIDNCREFIDAGHHKNPSTAYYYYDDDLYYFIDDRHSSYGTDNTGWYVYNTDLSVWDFYCDADDKDAIGEDLWYSGSSYYAGSTYDDIYVADEYLSTWTPTNFESTSWYHSYETNEYEYENDTDNDNDSGSDWDSDSDWDWDSGDSWDSGNTNWDSDW